MLKAEIEQEIANVCGAAVDACICFCDSLFDDSDYCEKLVDQALDTIEKIRADILAKVGNVCNVWEVNEELADILDWLDRCQRNVCRNWDDVLATEEDRFYNNPAW